MDEKVFIGVILLEIQFFRSENEFRSILCDEFDHIGLISVSQSNNRV